jgi:DNA polymerase-3 subunit gamma/tau
VNRRRQDLSYLVLARKYRPCTFEEVVGQSHVTQTLANAIESGRVGHAYLFSGPRGVGKTTTARLLAKSLNCPNAKGAVACNKCDVCREITIGTSLDVIEIDAASNRGIDEIRNLRENVKYAPAGGKHKVYVVDEVHMLTDPAFNALLKTLEEPPVHVKFILATTAPLKVPETILSRCQRFEFIRIPVKSIFTRIKDICAEEGFSVGDDLLMTLSRRANGSLRDAESMLDQLVSAGLQEADESAVGRLLGLSGADDFFSIMDAVQAGEAKKALETLGGIFDKGTNLDEFADGLMEHLRNLLLIKIHPDLSSLVEASTGHVKRYKEQAKQFTEGDLLRLIHLASRASFSVRRSELPRLHLETAVVEMAYLDSTAQVSDLLERLGRLEASVRKKNSSESTPQGSEAAEGSTEAATKRSEPASSRPQRTTVDVPEAKAPVPSRPKPGKTRGPQASESTNGETEMAQVSVEDIDKWKEILKRLHARKKTLGVCLSTAQFRGISQGKVTIYFEQDRSFEQSFVENKDNKNLLKEELADVFKKALGISCVRMESESAESVEGLKLEASPHTEALDSADSIEEDEESNENGSVKTIIEFFDGEIVN